MTKEKRTNATRQENSQESEIKQRVGRPKGVETVTPSLRIEKSLWDAMKEKYPGQVNKMFVEFVKNKLK